MQRHAVKSIACIQRETSINSGAQQSPLHESSSRRTLESSRGVAPEPAMLTSRADRVLQINKPGQETLSVDFDAVLDTAEVENDTIYDHVMRPLVSSAFLGTNSALVHFMGKRSAGLLSSLVGQPTSMLSQLFADLFDTISIKADTAACNISLAVLQVRREAVLDLLNPEQTVELNLHTDFSGRPHWNFEKLTEIPVSSAAEMTDLCIMAETRRSLFHAPSDESASNHSQSPLSSFPIVSITVRRQHVNESIRSGRLFLVDLPISAEDRNLTTVINFLEHYSQISKQNQQSVPSAPPAESNTILKVLHECFVGNFRTTVFLSAFPDTAGSEIFARVAKVVSECRSIGTRVQTNLMRSSNELHQIIETLSLESRWRGEALKMLTDLLKKNYIAFDLDKIESEAKVRAGSTAGPLDTSDAKRGPPSSLKIPPEMQVATLEAELHSVRVSLEAQNLTAQRRIRSLEASLSVALDSNAQLKAQYEERGIELVRAESRLNQMKHQVKRLDHNYKTALLELDQTRRYKEEIDSKMPNLPPDSALMDLTDVLSMEEISRLYIKEKSEAGLIRSKLQIAERRIADLDAEVDEMHATVSSVKELLRRQDEKMHMEREQMSEDLRRAQIVLSGKLSFSQPGTLKANSVGSLRRPESPPPTLLDAPLTAPVPRHPSMADSQQMSPEPVSARSSIASGRPESPQPPNSNSSGSTSPSGSFSSTSGSSSGAPVPVRAVSGRNLSEIRKILSPSGSSSIVVPPASSEEKGGWLMKEGGLVRNWKRRFFVFRQDRLLYFKDHNCKELKGEILLTPRSYVSDGFEHTKKENSFAIFDLNNSGRTYFLQAATKREAEEWIAFLNKKVKTLPHSSPN